MGGSGPPISGITVSHLSTAPTIQETAVNSLCGQREGLGLLVARLGAERHGYCPFEQRIGVRLEPCDLAEPGRFGQFHIWRVSFVGSSPASRATRVEASVGGDPIEPSPQRGPPVEPAQPPPRGQQRLLQNVLGVLERAEHPVAVRLEFATVRRGQLTESVVVASARPLY